MKIQVIFNTEAVSRQFSTGWGLSCLVNNTVLFDTGEKAQGLLDNIALLNINIARIKSVVISHEHWDHTGGLWKLLEQRSKLKVYICPSFSQEFKKRIDELKCILIESDKVMEIEKNIFLTGEIAGTYKTEYMAEQALVVKTANGLNVLTGCAHPGIINILEKVKQTFPHDTIHSVFGGFHLKDKDSEALQKIAEKFREMRIEKAGPTHCSGREAESIFQEIYKTDFIPGQAGSEFEV
ncbi:MAG: MBL fold metallo-hydrolase [Candidatus Omnitrophota bacterium]